MVASAHNHTETTETSRTHAVDGDTFYTAPRWAPDDPACLPERKSLASSNLDRLYTMLASILRLDSPQGPAKDRTAPLRPITLRRPSQQLNHQNTKRKLRTSRTVQYSLSAYSSSRKRKRSILKRVYLRSSLGFLIYLCIFSLLTVTHLDTWLASSCTRVTIWSILDLSATSYSCLLYTSPSPRD